MRFPLLRTAVKLSLIVLLTIQPVVTLAAGVECGSLASTCQGCGCCEVEDIKSLCDCCGGGSGATDAPTHQHGCCPESNGDVASKRKLQRSAAMERAEAKNESAGSFRAVAHDAARTDASGVQLSCSCQQSSQPLSDGNSSRTSNESRQTIAVGYLDFDATTLRLVSFSTNERPANAFLGCEHGAQVLLCIWRL